MDNLGKGDWSDPERVKHFIQTYHQRYGDQFWDAVIELVGSGSRDIIADFGCGPGIWLADAASRFKASKIFGLDESESMLEQAKEILKKGISPENVHLNLVNLDTEPININPNSLDLAFSGYLLHELANPNDFISQLLTCLKEQGVCIVFDFVSTDVELFVKTMKQVGWDEERARKRYPHMCKHSPEDIETILRSAGFTDISSKLLDVRAIVLGIKA